MNSSRENRELHASGWQRLFVTVAVLSVLLSMLAVAVGADQSSISSESELSVNPELRLFHRYLEDAADSNSQTPTCAGAAGLCTPIIDREERAAV